MSSIFSDPTFRRGTTLLAGEAIEVDSITGAPLAGNEIVGQIKAFQDVNPAGTGQRYSNRLVYCVAVRYVPSAVSTSTTPASLANADGADAGKVYTLSKVNGLYTFDGTLAASSDISSGRLVGVLDEYLKTQIRPYDIVWMVVKGPSTLKKGNTVVIPAASAIEASSGLGVVSTTFAQFIGQSIDNAAVATSTATAAITQTDIAISFPTWLASSVVAGSPVSAVGAPNANLPTSAYVASVGTVTTTGAISTATITLSGNIVTTAIPSGTVLHIGGPLRASTSARVNLFSNEF